jgi:hypothetical protein
MILGQNSQNHDIQIMVCLGPFRDNGASASFSPVSKTMTSVAVVDMDVVVGMSGKNRANTDPTPLVNFMSRAWNRELRG